MCPSLARKIEWERLTFNQSKSVPRSQPQYDLEGQTAASYAALFSYVFIYLFIFVKPEKKQIPVDQRFPATGGSSRHRAGWSRRGHGFPSHPPVATSADRGGFCAVLCAPLITNCVCLVPLALLKQSDENRCAEKSGACEMSACGRTGRVPSWNKWHCWGFFQISQIPNWWCTNVEAPVGPR